MLFYVIFSYAQFLPKFNVSYILTNKIFGETILWLLPFQTHPHVNDTTVLSLEERGRIKHFTRFLFIYAAYKHHGWGWKRD